MAGRIKAGCFLGAEAALYLGFLALDLLRPGSGWALLLKYGAVALCFLAALDRAGTEDAVLRPERGARQDGAQHPAALPQNYGGADAAEQEEKGEDKGEGKILRPSPHYYQKHL